MQSKSEQITELTIRNEELENYFSNTIIPQLFVDGDLILRKFTPPAMRQFSLREEHIGKSIEEVRENFRFHSIIDDIRGVIYDGNILEREIQTVDKRWYQMNILPYRIKRENRTNGVIITFVDITARIRDLRELEKLVAENELLIDTIVHDIRTPLTALGLTIQMLKKLTSKNMEKFTELLGYLDNSQQKIKSIANELVQSRWADIENRSPVETIDLENIFEDVKLTLAQQISQTKASIFSRLEVSEVSMSRRSLRSIIYNLVGNAIKYRSPDRRPEIAITSRRENNFILIGISDNGMGIAKDDQDRIFRKFERINHNVEGNGVGLYLVKELLQANGGDITVTSEAGKGSEFTIRLKA